MWSQGLSQPFILIISYECCQYARVIVTGEPFSLVWCRKRDEKKVLRDRLKNRVSKFVFRRIRFSIAVGKLFVAEIS
jgi:hypothetical protein